MKQRITLSPSTINLIQSCWRKFKYEKIEQHVPNSKAKFLEEGEIYHKYLESYYKGKMSERPDNVNQAILDGRTHSTKLNLDPSDILQIETIFKNYCLHYAYETWKPIAVEKPFSSTDPIHETEHFIFHLEFKTDLIVEVDGEIIAVDHKSKGKKSYPNKLNHQYIATCFGLGINKLIENVIYKQNTMDGAKLTFSDRFPRRLMEYSDEELSSWHDEMIDLCDDYEKRVITGRFPVNYTSCDKFSGCAFGPICSEPNEQLREYKLQRDFKKAVPYDIFKSQ